MSKHGVFSGPYFHVLGLYVGKYGPEKTPYLDTFHTVVYVPFRKACRKKQTHKANSREYTLAWTSDFVLFVYLQA